MRIKRRLLLVCIFLLCSFFSLGREYKAVEKVKNFSFEVEEINYAGKKQKKILSRVKMSLPTTFKKEILFPELNKGELYLYKGRDKTVYLPLFEQKKTTSLEENEIQVLDIIDILVKRLSSDIEFRKAYYDKKSVEFVINENYRAVIDSYSEVSEYIFPEKWIIRERGKKILELTLSKIVINPKLTEKDFQIP